MNHLSNDRCAEKEGMRATHTPARPSLSLSAEDATLVYEGALSLAPSESGADVALPRIVHPSTKGTSPTTLRWPPNLYPRSSEDAAATPHDAHAQWPRSAQTHTMRQQAMDAVSTKQQHLCSREEQEPLSLFSSRTRAGGEMSSFGISVSTATAAGGWSASTMPTRWLKSAEVTPLGVNTDSSHPSADTPRKNPSFVFERAVQRQVACTDAQEAAMLSAADHFAALFD